MAHARPSLLQRVSAPVRKLFSFERPNTRAEALHGEQALQITSDLHGWVRRQGGRDERAIAFRLRQIPARSCPSGGLVTGVTSCVYHG